MSPTRIYADFNGLVRSPRNSARTAVVLDTFGSLRDLSNAGLILSEGLPLIAVDSADENEDLEGHGTAQYDRDRKWWVLNLTRWACAMCQQAIATRLRNSYASPVSGLCR